ncbi:MAG: hypothetical protein ACKO0M_10465, partial [Cyanobium sp.]
MTGRPIQATPRRPPFLVALLLMASGGCAPFPRTPRSGPPLPLQPPLHKQVLQGYMPFDSIAWLSDEQLVFIGRVVGAKRSTKALYLWDRRGQPRPLLAESLGACITDEQILATVRGSGTERVRLISLQAPEFAPRPYERADPPGLSVYDPDSCSLIAIPDSLRERRWAPLRRGEGFLDFGPRQGTPPQPQAVMHLSADLLRSRDSGIRMPPPMLPQAVRAAHDGSYLVYDLHIGEAGRRHWLARGERTIWRLDRTGQGRPLTVPGGPWVGVGGGTIAFLPARPGLLIRSNHFDRRGRPSGAGLYLLRPGAPAQRLERGL